MRRGKRAANNEPEGGADDRLIKLKLSGLSYRQIGDEVGRDASTVFARLNKPAVRAIWEEGERRSNEEARQVGMAHREALVRTEILIATGELPATPHQVKALDNALSRYGLEKGQRIEVSRVLPDNLTREQLTAIADGSAIIDERGQFRAVGG